MRIFACANQLASTQEGEEERATTNTKVGRRVSSPIPCRSPDTSRSALAERPHAGPSLSLMQSQGGKQDRRSSSGLLSASATNSAAAAAMCALAVSSCRWVSHIVRAEGSRRLLSGFCTWLSASAVSRDCGRGHNAVPRALRRVRASDGILIVHLYAQLLFRTLATTRPASITVERTVEQFARWTEESECRGRLPPLS